MTNQVGERIAFFRKAKGLTVNKLANLAGISQSYLRDIELGKNNNPTIEIMECICDTLDITLKDFFDEETQKQVAGDELIREIYQLTDRQKERLLSFLKAMRD